RRPFEVDPEVIGGRCGLSVLVGAEEAEVEAPARELKVVRVAAECRDPGLGCENEPYVVVAAIAIEEVLPAVVKRHGLALSRLAGARGSVFAVLRDRGQLALARFVCRQRVQALGRGLDARRHLLDVDEHVGDLRAAAQLVFAAVRVKPRVEKTLATGRMLREAARDAMMIREDQ